MGLSFIDGVQMDRDKVLELARRSPEIVGRHEKEAWLDLFSKSAVIQDPVGAGPTRKGLGIRNGSDELARFWDVFIAPNRIEFAVNQDIVIGNEVVRDVLITTTLPNGAISKVPALLNYVAVEEDGKLKIEIMNAHWDLSATAIELLKSNGIKGLIASIRQFGTMIKVQGIRRVLRYGQAMYKRMLGKGIRSVKAFAGAMNDSDEAGFLRLVDSDAVIEFPAGDRVPASDFFRDEAGQIHVDVDSLRSGGWATSCVFDARLKDINRHGVALFQFNPKTKKISSARFFWNE